MQNVVMSMSVCMFVSISVYTNFSKLSLPVAYRRGIVSGGVVIRYALPVLQMTYVYCGKTAVSIDVPFEVV